MDKDQTVRERMTEFYKEKAFEDDAETARWIYIRFLGLKIPFPNLKARREAIYLHDLNHLLTGYDTSWTGEGEIAAYELASGFPCKHWIGYVYPPMTFSVGMLIAPGKTMRAFRRGRGKNNIYKLQLERSELDRMSFRALKEKLGGA